MTLTKHAIKLGGFLLVVFLINQIVACSDAKQTSASKGGQPEDEVVKKKTTTKKTSNSKVKKATKIQDGESSEGDNNPAGVVNEDDNQEANDTRAAIAMTPCGLFDTIAVSGLAAEIKQQVCSKSEFTQNAKSWLASPFTSAQSTPQEGVHYAVSNKGTTTHLRVNVSTRHPVSCTKMVTEVGAKVLFAPRQLGNFAASLTETTEKLSDIQSVGGSHVGGSVYQTVDRTSGLMNKVDTFQFQVNAYSGASGSVYVTVEETTQPGTDMQNRTTVNLLQAEGDNSCLTLSVTDMTVVHNGFHDTLVSSFLVPGLTQTIQLGFKEAQAAQR